MWSGYLAHRHLHGRTSGQDAQRSRRTRFGQGNPGHFHQRPRIPLGRTSLLAKGNLREEVTRVPLIIRSPGMKTGTSSSIVELVDMFPTACEIAGLPIPSSVQGKSLLPIIAKPASMVRNSAFLRQTGTSMRAPNAGPTCDTRMVAKNFMIWQRIPNNSLIWRKPRKQVNK